MGLSLSGRSIDVHSGIIFWVSVMPSLDTDILLEDIFKWGVFYNKV